MENQRTGSSWSFTIEGECGNSLYSGKKENVGSEIYFKTRLRIMHNVDEYNLLTIFYSGAFGQLRKLTKTVFLDFLLSYDKIPGTKLYIGVFKYKLLSLCRY